MSEVEEEIIRDLRVRLFLSLNDITEVVKRCVNPALSRSAIHRCLKRHGLSRFATKQRPTVGKFEDAPCGYIHMDTKHLPALKGKKSYVYVAIDRATRYVYVEVLDDRKQESARAFVERFIEQFPHPVHTILTDNGFEWTDRLAGDRVRRGIRKASEKHPVDIVCQKHHITHKLTKPFTPQTNGMVERFNRRINEAIANKEKTTENQGKNTFLSHHERNQFIHNFVDNYNKTRLRCLEYKAPLESLANQEGLYTSAISAGSMTESPA